MTTRVKIALLTAVLSMVGGLAAAHAQAPPCPGPGPWAASGRYPGVFDPKAVETIEGKVVAVDRGGMWAAINLRVKTASGTIDVHLGPAWFVDSGESALTAGEKVRIQGSRVQYLGKPLLIAMTLTRGEMTLRLRDAEGFPYWAGWRRRFAQPPGPGGGRGWWR